MRRAHRSTPFGTACASTSAQRIALDWPPRGELDATVDVYHAVRSQLTSVDCQKTDTHGKASLSFKASKNGLYTIRVAALASSQLATFTLEVFLPTPAVGPPGSPLPSGGANGQVDRIQNINAAYSFTMHAGVSYLINLANETEGACVCGALFAPGTNSFQKKAKLERRSSLLHISCGGYRLFTPGPGEGGRYSFEITPRISHAASSASTCRSLPPDPPKPRPGLGWATTPTRRASRRPRRAACCAYIASTSPATRTSRSG